MRRPPLRNILFDVDGTLVDSKRDIARAVIHVLHHFGMKHFKEEEIYSRIGRPLAVQLTELFPPELHSRIPEAVDRYLAYYRPHALDTTTLFPQVRETLAELQRLDFRLAVATTKSTATASRVLSYFDIERFFVHTQGTDGTPAKPDPYVIQRILEEQKWRPAETLMVGDTDVDIAAGKAAGVRTCGVTYGSFSEALIAKTNPEYIIRSMAELIDVVTKE